MTEGGYPCLLPGHPRAAPQFVCLWDRGAIYEVPGVSEKSALEMTRKKIEVFLAPEDFRSEKSQIQDTD